MARKRETTRNGHAADAPSRLDTGDGDAPPMVAEEPGDVISVAAVELPLGEPDVGNTLQTYLREIRRAPLLTPQEEYATAVRAPL